MNVAQLIVQLTDAIRHNPDVAGYTVLTNEGEPECIETYEEDREVWI